MEYGRDVQGTGNKSVHMQPCTYTFEYYPEWEKHAVNKYFRENYIYNIMLHAKKSLKSN